MARTWMVLALVFVCVVALSGWSDAAVLYAADGAGGHLSSLVILNPDTGAVTSVVGPIGFAVTGLAIHPFTGLLYGSTSRLDPTAAASLLRINKTTGLGTLIGSYGIPDGSTMPDITFTPDGKLYGWAQPINALHTINLATGQATRVGSFNFGANRPLGSGIAATTSSLILAGAGLDPIFRVDRNTGVAESIAVLDWPPPSSGMAALTFGPGSVLLAMGALGFQSGDGSFLLRIDLVTGHVTELGPTISLGDALAFDPPTFPSGPITSVPTLSELGFALLALLLMAVAVYRIRHRRVYQA